jgi:hypothetical protein
MKGNYMILEIALYCLVLMIVGMLVFKMAYGFYDSLKNKKPFEEIIALPTVEKIVGRLKCPKDFYCYKYSSNSLSNKENRGLKQFSFCLHEQLQECTFSVPSQNNFLCKCPLRDYIAKELENYETPLVLPADGGGRCLTHLND